jgi:hypothetical protein
MAELTINTADIVEALHRNLADFHPGVETAQVGRVNEVGPARRSTSCWSSRAASWGWR